MKADLNALRAWFAAQRNLPVDPVRAASDQQAAIRCLAWLDAITPREADQLSKEVLRWFETANQDWVRRQLKGDR